MKLSKFMMLSLFAGIYFNELVYTLTQTQKLQLNPILQTDNVTKFISFINENPQITQNDRLLTYALAVKPQPVNVIIYLIKNNLDENIGNEITEEIIKSTTNTRLKALLQNYFVNNMIYSKLSNSILVQDDLPTLQVFIKDYPNFDWGYKFDSYNGLMMAFYRSAQTNKIACTTYLIQNHATLKNFNLQTAYNYYNSLIKDNNITNPIFLSLNKIFNAATKASKISPTQQAQILANADVFGI